MSSPFPHAELRPMVVAISREYFCPGYTTEDLVQEAWVGAVQAQRDYQPGVGSLRGFVRLCVRRRLIDVVRVSRTQRVLNTSAREVDREGDDLEALVGHRETLREIAAARRRLTAGERTAFDNYVNGHVLASKSDESARYRALAKLRAAA